MKYSKLFSKTTKTVSEDEVSNNAQLLIKAGFVYKEMAGAYCYLPLGIRVLEKIKQIVREEMNKIGGEEFIMTSLQRKELWEKTDRWDDGKVDVWFKSALKNGTEVGFGWSHEEPISEMMKLYINSYRDLPVYVYQFQTKMRNELRAKSGIMRGREFVMKDMYSYSVSDEAHEEFYNKAKEAYLASFERLGLGDDTFFTFASGGAFTQFSHEFQTICDAGEDICYLHREKRIAVNEEVYNDEVLSQLGLKKEDLEQVKTAEVGNIFSFGSTKSEELDLCFTDEAGEKKPVILGSYGIGITRAMGVIVEKFHDENGIIWPENVAPFVVHIVSIAKDESDEAYKKAEELYNELNEKEIEVLWDDRIETRPGEKFADADLIGIPTRVVVSSKSLENGGYEVKKRNENDSQIVSKDELLKMVK
ncbi:prolyl-tRNA synthetase [Candidatus Dojkabacteria bacterium]|uniref:Proline--tRNA ligase n=1 Tax=Candidatus Dojkabacteria bacterium TaxID=2099670 RepID=A0A955LBQ0_9BACT|nr:prolyl-tRNA synthetase [Candidatus Dojkabacteria bacterium]